MQGTLIGLLVLAALACVLVAAMARELHGSDPAGNGLAQAYYVFALGLQWLLVGAALVVASVRAPHARVQVSLPWGGIQLVLVLLVCAAVAGQVRALPWLFDGRNGGAWRVAVRVAQTGVPLAFLVYAAWRGVGLALPSGVALVGCGGVVIVGSIVPFVAQTVGTAGTGTGITELHVPYPALLLRGGDSVQVLRHAEELRGLLADDTVVWEGLRLVDANCGGYVWTEREGAGLGLVRDVTPIVFEELVEELLRIERLHADPLRDAEIRRLVRMQGSVSALSFVLGR